MSNVELTCQDVVPPVLYRAGRAGEGKYISAARDAGGCTRLHRRCSDLLVTQPTEQFTKAGYFLVLHLGQGFGGNVAAGHARAAGRNDAVNLRLVDPAGEPGDDLLLVVLFQIAGTQDVTCSLHLFVQKLPRPAFRQCSVVTHGTTHQSYRGEVY